MVSCFRLEAPAMIAERHRLFCSDFSFLSRGSIVNIQHSRNILPFADLLLPVAKHRKRNHGLFPGPKVPIVLTDCLWRFPGRLQSTSDKQSALYVMPGANSDSNLLGACRHHKALSCCITRVFSLLLTRLAGCSMHLNRGGVAAGC